MKLTFGLLAGIAIGAALTHYLTSKEGSALIGKIKDDINDAGEKIASLAEDLVEKGKSLTGTDSSSTPVMVEETIVVLMPEQEQPETRFS